MKCPKCHFENIEGVKFCNECGAKLEVICPSCGKANPPGSKFCNDCGNPFVPAPPPPDYSKPHSYTPKFLADKILTTRSAIEGERKLVTVLFADVANFTSLSEKLDPEEIHEIMDGCFKILMDEVHKYEGTINQFTGDGVMALFGAPLAHEDHAQRACHAALAIQDSLTPYSQRLEEEHSLDFRIRLGLNSGPVVVGAIGDDLRMDYTAIGDTINLASRMESFAQPGTILVSKHTHRLARDFFTFEPLGKIQVKGKKEPQEAFVLLAPSGVKTRLTASAIKGALTPFIGREHPMALLMEAYNHVREGSGQVVEVVGEAGVGKSRLLLEFRSLLPRDEATYLEGRCIHFGFSMAYLPLLDALRSYFGIKEGDKESLIRNTMKEKVEPSLLAPLEDLFSLPVADEQYVKLEPKEKRERIFEALRDLFIRESQNHPIILVIEDLHWIDKTTEEFLDYLMGSITTAKILLILLHRPEYTHPWGSRSYFNRIGLTQLTMQSSAELVRAILEGKGVAPELSDLILTRAAGNPLFMEELTHNLLENGSIEMKDDQYVLSRLTSIAVPDTIQGIIAARMDRLEENLKQIMQVASVIGREFAFRVLHAISGMRKEVKADLLDLQRLELIYEKSLFPELEYIFKHALIQEVAYNSLLLKRRKAIHERIGHAIEELYPDRLEEFYEMLAYHYTKSDNQEKAYHYLKLSGNKAMKGCSNQEALLFYKDAIAILRRKPQTTENKRELLDVILLMGLPAHYLNYPGDSLSVLEEGVRLCEELGDRRGLANLYNFISLFYTVSGNPALGGKYLEDAFREAERMGDVEIMGRTAPNLCSAYVVGGSYGKVLDVAPRVIALLEKTHREHDFFGLEANAYSTLQACYGYSLGALGEFAEGERACEKALSVGRDVNHLFSIGFAELCYGLLFYYKGDGESVVRHTQGAIECFEKSQVPALVPCSWGLLGDGYYFLGKLDSALESAEKGLQMQRDAGLPFILSFYHLGLGRIHADLGNWQDARLHGEEGLKIAQTNHETHFEGLTWILLGRIIGKTDPSQTDTAEEHILQGMRVCDELKMKPAYATGYLALGGLHAGAGHKEEARENLKKAEAMFQEMDMDYYLVRTKKLFESLEREIQ